MNLKIKGNRLIIEAENDQDEQDLTQMLMKVGEIFRKNQENGNNQS